MLRTTVALLAIAALGGCPMAGSTTATLALRFNTADPPTPVTTADSPVFRTFPVFESIDGRNGSHCPTITTFPDGELLAAWYSYVGPGELDGVAIYAGRRPAGRDLWDPPELLVQRRESVGNPVLYSEGDAVWLFFAVVPGSGWSTAHIELQRSADRGHTWSPPQLVDGPLGSNVRFPPVRTPEGDLLLPAYDDLLQRCLFFASPDGANWTLRATVSADLAHPCIQPSVAVLGSGRLLAVQRNVGHGWLWVTASDDSGRTWAPPIDSRFPNPASPSALLRLADGHLVLVYNDSNRDRRPVSAALSADEGVTWHPPRVLVDGTGAYAYPSAIQTADGLIHIVYSHDRQRIQHLILNEAWIVAPAAAGS